MDLIIIISSVLLWVLMAFNIIFTLGLARRLKSGQSFGPSAEMLDFNSTIPEFSLPTLRGEKVSNKLFTGKKLALLFMSPNCGPCREKIPTLYQYWQKAQKADVEVILVSDMGKEETEEFIEGHRLDNMTILLAQREESSFLLDYKAKATPSYYLIDEQSKVRGSGIGFPEIAQLNNTFA